MPLVQDFKKVSVSQLVAEKEKLNISDVLAETISLMTVSLKRNNVSINVIDKLKAVEELDRLSRFLLPDHDQFSVQCRKICLSQ